MNANRKNPMDRFTQKVDKSGDCWIWNGFRDRDGYGRFQLNGICQMAHRASYALHIGSVPSNMEVLHSCDNPSCVNPAHLSIGTHAENMKEMTDRKRQAAGSRHPCAKLSEPDVVEIRRRIQSGEIMSALAAEYGVAKQQISAIKLGKTWRHVA